MNLETRHKQIIEDILSKYQYQFFIFGSRIRGDARKFSDLDLCYKQTIPAHIISDIKESFEESNLPFTIDILDWNQLDKSFQKQIAKDIKPFN